MVVGARKPRRTTIGGAGLVLLRFSVVTGSTSSTGRRRLARLSATALFACVALSGTASAAPRIIAGDGADAGDWPSIARIEARYTVDGANYVSRCAGTVVSTRWVVTAAHCTYDGTTPLAPSALTAITGRSDLARLDEGQTIAVDAIVRHPDHVGGTLQADIALVRLTTPTTAPPMAVATPEGAEGYSSPAGVANVAGWGWTQAGTPGSGSTSLNEAYMPLRPTADCIAALRPYDDFDAATMICAGGPAGQPTTCHGDSGGPLVLFTGSGDSARPVLAGITSWGSPRCDSGVTAFTRVATFATFVAPALAEPAPVPVPAPAPAPVPVPADPPAAQPVPAPSLARGSSVPQDAIAPRLSELRVPPTIAVRGGRATRAITVRLRSSEPALVRITLLRSSGGVAHRRHSAVLARGANRLTLPRSLWRLRPGSYRLWIEATDTAGNSSAADAKIRARRAR